LNNVAKSIRVRLVGLSVVIFGIAISALAFILFRGIESTQQAAFDSALHNYTVDIANGFDLTYLGDLVLRRDAILEENKVFPFPLGQAVIQVRSLDGAVLLASRGFRQPLPISREAMELAAREGSALETRRLGKQDFRVNHHLVRRPAVPPLLLQVAVPLTALEAERERLLPLIWVMIPLALAAAAMVGFVTSTRALAPVYRIIEAARAIRPGELTARVPVPEETELNELALTLNDLLERLQKAFDSQENFIADASHQLKTPLAIIRGELDVFRSGPKGTAGRTMEETGALLASLSQEANQLAKMVDDLLLLARFDSGTQIPVFSVVRLDEILLDVISQLESRARGDGGEGRIEIVFNMRPGSQPPRAGASDEGEGEEPDTSEFEVKGDADLLRALFFNLIENAIKYSPRPGRVAIELIGSSPRDHLGEMEKDGSDRITVTVSDDGPGIRSEEIDRIFDRFYRGSQIRHRVPGVGLGLSIAHRIARFHGADLSVRSQPGAGATFVFRLLKKD